MRAVDLVKGYKRAIAIQVDRMDIRYTREGQDYLNWLLDMHSLWHAVWRDDVARGEG